MLAKTGSLVLFRIKNNRKSRLFFYYLFVIIINLILFIIPQVLVDISFYRSFSFLHPL